MVEAFLLSIVSGVESLGWSSIKKIAEHTNWDIEEVTEALSKLQTEGRILSRKKGRGYQYGPLVEKPRKTLEEKPPQPIVPIVPSDKAFESLDELLLEGSLALPKNVPYTAKDFGAALLVAFPKSLWNEEEIISGIGKLVRLQRLQLIPYMENSRLKYQYVVK